MLQLVASIFWAKKINSQICPIYYLSQRSLTKSQVVPSKRTKLEESQTQDKSYNISQSLPVLRLPAFGRVGASAMIVMIPKKHLASVWDLKKHLAAVFCLEVQTQRKSPHFSTKTDFSFSRISGNGAVKKCVF